MLVYILVFTVFVTSPALSAVVKDLAFSCSLSEYACSDGACVSAELVCDGNPDCADASDEMECQFSGMSLPFREPVLNRSKRQSNCRKNQWKCRDGSCIPFDGKCDGVVDCPDGSDETHPLCRKNTCQSNWFRCTYGACVDGTAPCNGLQECADNSDELLPRCRNETEEVRGRFKCEDGSSIPAENHCDGKKDCTDGTDETVRACAGKTCYSYLFQCAYGACADSDAECNKVQDCADGSDESEELCGTTPTNVIKPTTGNCVLPPYPEHGSYGTNIIGAQPGFGYKFITLDVTCHRGYGTLGSSSVSCRDGIWRASIPKCVRQCRLDPHPSVEYRCQVTGLIEGSRGCNAYEPSGTVVIPECRKPDYYSSSTLTFMKCIDGYWSSIARCTPGSIRNGTNITILLKDTVEVYKSEFFYHVPITESQGVTSNTDSGVDDTVLDNRYGNGEGVADRFNDISGYYYGQVVAVTEGKGIIGLNDYDFNTFNDNNNYDWGIKKADNHTEIKNNKSTESKDKANSSQMQFHITNSSVYINSDRIVFRD